MSSKAIDDDTGKSSVLFRTACFLAVLGMLSLIIFLLGSPSRHPDVLGRYSYRLVAMMAILLGSAAVMLKPVLNPAALAPLRRAARAVPGWVAAMTLVLPPPVLFLLWFLFPIPLFNQPFGIAGMALLAVCPGMLLFGSYSREKLREAKTGLLITFFSMLLGLGLLEVVARITVPGNLFSPRFGLCANQRCLLRVDLEGVSPEGVMTTNRWGLRGDEPPADWEACTTIITVGGSTTIDYYLDDSKTWASILQERLRASNRNVWVGNAGIPAHSTVEHILLLEEVISRIRPDIIVFLIGVNDLRHLTAGGRAVSRDDLDRPNLRRVLFDNVRLLLVIRKAKMVFLEGAEHITGTCLGRRQEIEEILSTPLTGPRPEADAGLPDDTGFYEASILRMIELCRGMGATPVFMTQPLLYEDNEHWRGIWDHELAGATAVHYSAAEAWLMLDALNRKLIEVCAREGVACFDLAAAVPHERTYFYDSAHFTETGTRLIGEELAAFLLSAGVLGQ